MTERKRLFATIPIALVTGLFAGCQDLPNSPPSQGTVNESLGGTSYGSGASPQRMAELRAQVGRSDTADLNGDGFVTLDEVVAMKQAGLSDDQMLARLRATKQLFQLTPQQESYLRAQGIDNSVINEMEAINRPQLNQQLYSPGSGTANPPGAVISVPPPEQPPRP